MPFLKINIFSISQNTKLNIYSIELRRDENCQAKAGGARSWKVPFEDNRLIKHTKGIANVDMTGRVNLKKNEKAIVPVSKIVDI